MREDSGSVPELSSDGKEHLTPAQIVAELDKYVIGQTAAKRAVAVALRNRDRRRSLPEDVRRDIMPKNILMIGPTGVGKTEIARRVAQLVGAPFVKVEATRFTEVGYVGRDVDSIVRELVDSAVEVVHKERAEAVREKAEQAATERLAEYLCQQYPSGRVSRSAFRPPRGTPSLNPRSGATPASTTPANSTQPTGEAAQTASTPSPSPTPAPSPAEQARARRRRRQMARLLATKTLEDAIVEVEVADDVDVVYDPVLEFSSGMTPEEMTDQFQDFVSHLPSGRGRYRRVSVREARRILTEEETEKLIDHDAIVDEAISRVEEMGVVFIDELDKIAGPAVEVGPDVSGEGVQRDLLPIVEGCSVMTRYGPVRTDHMLFIAAGSFHKAKPSDLIPELQGRFPLRVELQPLTEQDFVRILSEPQNALTRQYQALLGTEGIRLEFTPEALQEIAHFAVLMNERTENIGARRLATIMERLLEDLSFRADAYRGQTVVVDGAFVRDRLTGLVADEDLSRYIL